MQNAADFFFFWGGGGHFINMKDTFRGTVDDVRTLNAGLEVL